jgi:hypothetical protein
MHGDRHRDDACRPGLSQNPKRDNQFVAPELGLSQTFLSASKWRKSSLRVPEKASLRLAKIAL